MKESFKNLPSYIKPREKAINEGIDSLSNEELLALILRCGTKEENVLQLSSSIMNKYKTFADLVNANYNELTNIKGIKKAKAIEILAIMEIAKRVQKDRIHNFKLIRNSLDVYNNFSFLLREEKQEIFMVIYLNIKSHIIKYEKLFQGGVNSSIVDVNLIFKNAISYGASKIICLHNHPSGDPSPSKQDAFLTEKIKDIGELLNIKLLDHIIIGKNNYYSFSENL